MKKYRLGEAKFCSLKCRSDYAVAQGRRSEATRIRQSLAMRQWRIAVFKRDDYTCQICGERGGTLNADHIKPFAYFPELRCDVDNGRTLCEECHRDTGSFGGRVHAYVQTLAS